MDAGRGKAHGTAQVNFINPLSSSFSMDPDRYIKNIVRSEHLFNEPKQRNSKLTSTILLVSFLVLALVAVTFLKAQPTGYAIKRYVVFDAELAKTSYTLGEQVTVQIAPEDAAYSIALVKGGREIQMLDSLGITPQEPGAYTLNVLLYLGEINERFELPFTVVE